MNTMWVRISESGVHLLETVEADGARQAVMAACYLQFGGSSHTEIVTLAEVRPGWWEGTVHVFNPLLGQRPLPVVVERK